MIHKRGLRGPYLGPAFYEAVRQKKPVPTDQGNNLLVTVNLDEWPSRLSAFMGKVSMTGPDIEPLARAAMEAWGDLSDWCEYDIGDGDPLPPGSMIKVIDVDRIRAPIKLRLIEGFSTLTNPYIYNQ